MIELIESLEFSPEKSVQSLEPDLVQLIIWWLLIQFL